MSHLKLNSDIREHVKSEYGSDIPDPNGPEFETFLDGLEETRPDLATALVQGLEVEGAELPEEMQARKANRREARKNLFHRLFFSQSYAGDPSLNKRKTLSVIVGVLVALLPIAYLVDTFAGRRRAENTLPDPASQTSKLFIPSQDQSAPTEHLTTASVPNDLPSAATRFSVAQGNLPPPPGPVNPDVTGAPPISTSSTGALLSVGGQELSVPTPPSTLSVYTVVPSAPATLTAVAPSPAPAQLSLPPVANQSMTTGTPLQRLSLVAQQTPTLSESSSLSILKAGALPEDASLTLASNSRSQAFPEANSGDSSLPRSLQLASASQTNQASTSDIPPSLPEDANLTDSEKKVPVTARAPSFDPSSKATQPADLTLQPGAQLPARLVTGIIVTDGINTPVVAETPAEGSWCAQQPCPAVTWLGTAHLERPGRISLQLEQAVVEGEARKVTAIALGEDKLPGLAASMSDVAPTVIQDLLRAAAGGVSDYIDAVASRQKVTVTEGNVVIQDLEPSLDRFLLGRTAKLFDLPSSQTALVRVAQVAPGTSFKVLYGVGE